MSDLPLFWHAVHHFWLTRRGQIDDQIARNVRDQGSRGAVTGGGHLDGFLITVQQHLRAAGVPVSSIITGRRATIIPGYFRPTKSWDLLVVHGGRLLAALEFKSQVGSFGNNANNRVEEAIGNAVDALAAHREGAFGSAPRPFLGYLFLLQDTPAVHRHTRTPEPYFRVLTDLSLDPPFGGSFCPVGEVK